MKMCVRPGLVAVALWSALSLGATAGAAPKAPEPECDAMCELGRYLDRDHMVALAPAAAPEVPASSAPAPRPARTRPAPKTARAKGVAPLRSVAIARPSPAETAPAPPVAERRAAEPTRHKTAKASTIPGGAPLITSQFETQR